MKYWNFYLNIALSTIPKCTKEVVLSNSIDFFPKGFQMKEEHILQPPADIVYQLFLNSEYIQGF